MNRHWKAAYAAGLVALAAAVSSLWLGQHMHVWTALASVALVVLTARAEREGTTR